MTVSTSARHTPRVEDEALITGKGRFSDDLRLPNQAYAAFVRSPHAHARIVSVNTEAAKKAKGVLAVLTAADMNEAGDALPRRACRRQSALHRRRSGDGHRRDLGTGL